MDSFIEEYYTCPNRLCDSDDLTYLEEDGKYKCGNCNLVFTQPRFYSMEPAVSVVKALMMGIPVTLGGREYEIGFTAVFGRPVFGVRMRFEKEGQEPEEVISSVHITLEDFLALCDSMSHEALFTLNANIALNQEVKRKYKRRQAA